MDGGQAKQRVSSGRGGLVLRRHRRSGDVNHRASGYVLFAKNVLFVRLVERAAHPRR